MRTWTPERTAELVKMRAEGLSYSRMAERLFGTPKRKGMIAGKLSRLEGRAVEVVRVRKRKRKPASERRAEPNNWDQRLFEPWAEYTARKKLERQNANP